MERVLVRSIDLEARWSLVFEMAPTVPITATVARAILGDRVPVIAWDDSGPDGALVFPGTPDGYRLAKVLRDQLHEAIAENVDARCAQAEACPAESFPEPGAPDVDADDFAEPVGGESARVAAEEAAWEAQIRAAATRAPVPEDRTDILWGGWRPGDRFVISPDDDEGKRWAAIHLWITACPMAGRVIDRVRLHTGIGGGDLALLVQIEGRPERVVVRVGVLCATAKKV